MHTKSCSSIKSHIALFFSLKSLILQIIELLFITLIKFTKINFAILQYACYIFHYNNIVQQQKTQERELLFRTVLLTLNTILDSKLLRHVTILRNLLLKLQKLIILMYFVML